jgi:hypothetical protein
MLLFHYRMFAYWLQRVKFVSLPLKDKESRISLLTYGLELSQFKRSLPLMLGCFKHFRISLPELSALEAICTPLIHTSPQVQQAMDVLNKLKVLIADLTPSSMQYFHAVKQAHQVVQFFYSQTEFQTKFDLLTAKYQGHAYGLVRLDNLFSVFEMLEPFVGLLRGITS